MSSQLVTFVWVDGGEMPMIRSKMKTVVFDGQLKLESVPAWSADGSSMGLARDGDVRYTDVGLNPVRVYGGPGLIPIVLCEAVDPDTGAPHSKNYRAALRKALEGREWASPLCGLEQEYVILDRHGRPSGWPDDGYPAPQGPYYCRPNAGLVPVVEHANTALQYGLSFYGHNAEVMLGQWEFQIGTADPLKAADDLWVARELLHQIVGIKNQTVTFDPKPVPGDWNGSGLHTNFSTSDMRAQGGLTEIERFVKMASAINLGAYGSGNDRRLTGMHETSKLGEFSSGVADRSASIRVPGPVAAAGCGYFEDRRPAASADPYRVLTELVSLIEKR